MSSLTASLHETNLKKNIARVNLISSRLNTTVTATAASTFLMLKVPNKAVITDFNFYAKDKGDDMEWKLGIQQPEGSTSGSTTVSKSALLTAVSSTGATGITSLPIGNKLPYKVSLSGEATPKWAWVVATNSAAISASADLRLILTYVFDSDL